MSDLKMSEGTNT